MTVKRKFSVLYFHHYAFLSEILKVRNVIWKTETAQKMKFSIKDFFSKCDQIRSFLRIWSHLLKKFLMENFFFVQWEYSMKAWKYTLFL